jgi:hypothetical protein
LSLQATVKAITAAIPVIFKKLRFIFKF